MIRTLLLSAVLSVVMAPAHAQTPTASPSASVPDVADPATYQPATDFGPNSTCENALHLKASSYREGFAMEDAWLASNYPHHFLFDRHDVVCDGHPTSATVLFAPNDHGIIVYFDQSGYGAASPSK